VDTGFNENYLRSLVPDVAFGGGFIVNTPNTPFPGDFQSAYKSMPTGHGNMIARNILRIAPRVRLFDAPILPPRVTDVQEYTFMVELLFEAIQELRSLTPYAHQPWLIVNAWAVADSIQERGLGPQNMLYTPRDLNPILWHHPGFPKIRTAIRSIPEPLHPRPWSPVLPHPHGALIRISHRKSSLPLCATRLFLRKTKTPLAIVPVSAMALCNIHLI